MDTETPQVDLNHDGVIDEAEMQNYIKKTEAHRKIAYVSLASILVFTGFLMSPLVDVERVNALSDLFSMFYVMTGSIVATFMGVSSWLSKK